MVMRHEIGPGLTVSGQLTDIDLQSLARDGVRTIINNRPNGEEPGQMPAADAARAAAALGLSYHHLPVTMAGLTVETAKAFGTVVANAEGGVHAHCRSGARSANLWVLHRLASADLTPDQARQWGTEHQVDVGPAAAAFRHEQGR